MAECIANSDMSEGQTAPTSSAMGKIHKGSNNAQPFIRSCVACRKRKTRCDRQHPCANCARQGAICTYPAGPGRAPKGTRKQTDPRILNRLARMETLVKQLEHQAQMRTEEGSNPSAVSTPTHSESTRKSDRKAEQSAVESPDDARMGRLVIGDSKSCYVSNVFWANLGDQIEGLRSLLDESDSEDEDGPQRNLTSSSDATPFGLDAALMGFRSLTHSLYAHHPTMIQSVALLGAFQENVVPVVRIFHMPTLTQIFWDAVAWLDHPDKDTEALLFAIYYSAVISMDSQHCLTIMGVSRSTALQNLRFATEQALARANLLGTQSMTVLQAAVLFLSALRHEDDSRNVWSFTSLVYHLARAMGLHRDGAAFGLKPLEVELRRRLWWHVCLLDIRSSEYHGCEPIVPENSFDTRLPLNVNDSDLTADMAEAPQEREEATEMTFCLIRCESLRVVWKISYTPTTLAPPESGPELSFQGRVDLVEGMRARLNERYVQRCDMSQPFYFAAATVARLITARTWLVVHYPLTRQPDQTALPAEELWQRLFQTSTEILDLSLQLSQHTKWTWHSKTQVQWHAVALVLSMICSQPPSPDCDRAWERANAVYNRWNVNDNMRKGTWWKPIRRLMAKARYVRQLQATHGITTYFKQDGGQKSASHQHAAHDLGWVPQMQDRSHENHRDRLYNLSHGNWPSEAESVPSNNQDTSHCNPLSGSVGLASQDAFLQTVSMDTSWDLDIDVTDFGFF